MVTTKDGGTSETVGYYDLSYIFPDNSTIPDLLESIETSVYTADMGIQLRIEHHDNFGLDAHRSGTL